MSSELSESSPGLVASRFIMFDLFDSVYKVPRSIVGEIVAAESLEGLSEGWSIQDLEYSRAYHSDEVKIGCLVVPSVPVAVPVPRFSLCDP